MRRLLIPVVLVAALTGACTTSRPVAHERPSPSPSPSSSPSMPVGAVPAGFTPVDATFVSDSTGWVLGTVPCTESPDGCDLVARTQDGGRTWRALPAPGDSGGGELRFANARDGFLLGGGLLVTHDGGETWDQVDTLASAIHEPWWVETARGQLWVLGRVDHGGVGLWHGPLTAGALDFSQAALPDGDGGEAAFALHGRAVLVTYPDPAGHGSRLQVAADGARFAHRRLPCSGDGRVAPRTSTQYLLVCLGDAAAGKQDTQAFLTADAGRTWRRLAAPPQLAGGRPLATGDALFVASDRAVAVSRDGGRSWRQALRAATCGGPECGFHVAGFESSRLGFLVEVRRGGSVMHLSHDDGRTWQVVDFSRVA